MLGLIYTLEFKDLVLTILTVNFNLHHVNLLIVFQWIGESWMEGWKRCGRLVAFMVSL